MPPIPKLMLTVAVIVWLFAVSGCERDKENTCSSQTASPNQTSAQSAALQQGIELANEANREALAAIREASERLGAERGQQLQEMLAANQTNTETMLDTFFERVKEREVSQRTAQKEMFSVIERTSKASVEVLSDQLQATDELRRLEQAAGHDRLLTAIFLQPLYAIAPMLMIVGGLWVWLQQTRRRYLLEAANHLERETLQQKHSLSAEMIAHGVPAQIALSLPSLQTS